MHRHERPLENLNADKARGMRKVEGTEFDVEERRVGKKRKKEGRRREREREDGEKAKTNVPLSRREKRETVP